MKTITTILFLSFLGLLAVSCNKTSTKSAISNYMIVGHDGGFIDINSPYFIITGGGLTEDTTQYPNAQVPYDLSGFHFNYKQPTQRYDTVKDLLASIPPELLGKNGQTIGQICPDFGYDDIRASINGIVYKWQFECDQSGSSAAVQAFVAKIRKDF